MFGLGSVLHLYFGKNFFARILHDVPCFIFANSDDINFRTGMQKAKTGSNNRCNNR